MFRFDITNGKTTMASRLGAEVVQMLVESVVTKVEVVDFVIAGKVANSTIEVVGQVATRAELVDSLNAAKIVNSTVEVVDPTTVESKTC